MDILARQRKRLRSAIARVPGLLLIWSVSALSAGSPMPERGGADAEKLMVADRAFATASAARGAEAWSEVWADRGLLYGDGGEPTTGPAAVERGVAEVVEDLRWEPVDSGMLWPGDLGFTAGQWWMGSETPPEAERRRYLTIWRRLDHDWKVVLNLTIPEQETSSAARGFDFWLGDWNLEQQIWSGHGDEFEAYPAENQVRAIEGGGALIENFQGVARFFWLGMEEPASMRGVSVRVYYPDAREWRIFWMDTLQPSFGLPFVGGFSGDVGEFLLTDRPGGIPPSRIRFERKIDGAVHWQLALRASDGKGWQPLWLIEFNRDDGEPAK